MTAAAPVSRFPRRDATDPVVWDRWAASLEHLTASPLHAVVIAPHPDDETFGCGGLIADLCRNGVEVTVITASDGAASHPEHHGISGIRRAEQAAAVSALGCRAEPVRLDLPDGSLAAHAARLRAGLVEAVAGADLIVAPWPGDRHPDHEVVGRVAADLASQRGIKTIAYPVWLWRWGSPAALAGNRWARWTMSAPAHRAKRSALRCYPSQTTDGAGAVIVDGAMLARFSRPYEVYADA